MPTRGLDRIHEQLAPILLRRTRQEVLKDLPERTDKVYRVPLTSQQAEPYFEQSDLLAQLMRKWERQGWLSEIDQKRILCCIQNMRMLCNSTFLFDKQTHHSPKLQEFREVMALGLRKLGRVQEPGPAVPRSTEIYATLNYGALLLDYSPYTQSKRMSTHLDTILTATRATVAAAKKRVRAAELERIAATHRTRGWAAALRRQVANGPAIIAEIKKASPSKGLIRADFDVEWIARRYLASGATALSVLTDEPFFQGGLRNLELASAAVPLPCLRKDFIVDEYQIAEARAHRADAILLIAAALGDAEMKQFAQAARGLMLDVLVEVHTAAELDRVLDLLGEGGADAIGVNNRDLRSFEVRLETSLELVARIPDGVVRVTESGIAKPDDLVRLRAAGFDAFLIGESLMRQADPGAALAELLATVSVTK